MDIVDGQLHMGRGKIGATLEAMDALGIQSVLIDEFWGEFDSSEPTHIQPGYLMPNGAWRAASPTAEEASLCFPTRFSYLIRIDRKDPHLESLMRTVGSSPHARAFRLQPAWTQEEANEFSLGAYDELLGIAQEIGLPVFLFLPGYVELLPPYLRKFPRLQFIVDHCGMGFPDIPPDRPPSEANRSRSLEYFDEVLKLGAFSNVALKWSHAQSLFGVPDYPFEPLRSLIRRAINAFGAERLMWASDKSVVRHRWSDLLHYIRDDPGLAAAEKDSILGRTARRLLSWPVAATTQP